MEYRLLGQTGFKVSELCFGALPLGPIQKNIPFEDGVKLLRQAVEAGVNFIDTAEMYGTHAHIREALMGWDKEVIVATKSTASSYEDMATSIEKARQELDRDVIDVFHIHAARADQSVFSSRAGAIDCLIDYKAKGVVKAIGISTHAVDVVAAAATRDEFDVVYPIINKLGLGILNGNLEEMLNAIAKVHKSGKGMYAMKALAGGHLIDDLLSAIDYVRQIPGMASTSIGMVEPKELDMNLRIFNSLEVHVHELPKSKDKRLIVLSHCAGCNHCTTVCPNYALSMEGSKAKVDHQKCILCGYCSPQCPMFALRLV